MKRALVFITLVLSALSSRKAPSQTTSIITISPVPSERNGRPVYSGRVKGEHFFRDDKYGDAEWPGMTNLVFEGKDYEKNSEPIHIGVGQLKVTETDSQPEWKGKTVTYTVNLLVTNETKDLQCFFDGKVVPVNADGHPMDFPTWVQMPVTGPFTYAALNPGKEFELEKSAKVSVPDNEPLATGWITLNYQCLGPPPTPKPGHAAKPAKKKVTPSS
jgi:hypothetical protein